MNEEITLNVTENSPYVIGAIAYVEQLEDGARITIVDKNGTTTATVDDGNGIQSVTLNADYTLTIFYTDGTSVTTTSIRGEKGESGVYIGEEEPSDPEVDVWIDPTGDPYPIAETIEEDVNTWLDEHPEATTTVQDGAITVPKFAAGVVDATLSQTGHPADAKATGDAFTADRTRLTAVEGEADALDARITNLARLTDGSTTGDAELIDARVVGSTTYSTLHEAIDTEFTNVKADINVITGNEVIPITEYNKYINLSGATADITTPTSSDSGYKYCLVSCSAGDVFTVSATGGAGARAWGFVDSQGNVLQKSDANAVISNHELIAPTNTSYLIINTKGTTRSYFGALVASELLDINAVTNDLYFINQPNNSTANYTVSIPANTEGVYRVKNDSADTGWFKLELFDADNAKLWEKSAFSIAANSEYSGTFSIEKEATKLTVTNTNNRGIKFRFAVKENLIKSLDAFYKSTNADISNLYDFTGNLGELLYQRIDHTTISTSSYWANATTKATASGYSAFRINGIPSGTYHINALSAPFTYFINKSTNVATKASDMGMSDIGSETEITINYDFDLCLTISSQFDNTAMLSNGKLPTNYVFGAYGVSPTDDFKNRVLAGVPKTFYCGSTREYTTLKSVVEEATKYMDSIVYVDAETFDLANEFGSEYLESYNQDFACGLFLKNRIHLIFAEGSKVLFNYEGENSYIHRWFAPFNSDVYGFTLENCNIEAVNCRYAVHDERAWASDAYHNIYKRCTMEHTADGVDWTTSMAIGGGLGQHGDILIEDGSYKCGGSIDISYHNSTIQNVETKSKVVIRNAYLNGTTSCANYGTSSEKSQMIINGCSLGTAPILERTITPERADNMELITWNNVIRS